ncbi:MAG: hypothetical protein KBD06_00800 [Candidatus Pacebacteria bacterium]|nr:hypothetical protein [Candidatus Paceibacterota bacterium]
MAKDYFQDILPPQNGGRKAQARSASLKRDPDVHRAPTVVEESITIPDMDSDEDEVLIPGDTASEGSGETSTKERSIRNISAPRRVRDDMRDAPRYSPPMQKTNKPRRKWLWLVVFVLVSVVGILAMIALRGTSVSVEPRSHTVVFDETSRFTAYPKDAASAGSLTYTTQTIEIEDSEPVESSGTIHAEEKASGTITVYNDYSTTPVKLIKNTRFEAAGGLIFRAPADISVPGKSGTTPGQVTVTVVADAVGEQYNIAPGKLTVPGLKGATEYDKVYAQAASAFTGGFNGDRPGVSEGALAGARSAVRARLEQKARDAITALSTGEIATFPELAQITYTTLPTTSEGTGAKIHEKMTAVVPLLSAPEFALAVARTVSAETENATIRMVPMQDFGGLLVSASTTPGVDPVQIQLTGQAMLVWQVNATELAQALAGRDQSAFQTIVTGFPGIQSATARIEPFWSSTFPGDASRIRIKIADPSTAN